MTDFIPDPANYTMKPPKDRPIPFEATNTHIATQIDPTDAEAVKAMVWDKLVAMASVMPANASALPVLRELLDRIEGKPMQRTESKILAAIESRVVIEIVGATNSEGKKSLLIDNGN